MRITNAFILFFSSFFISTTASFIPIYDFQDVPPYVIAYVPLIHEPLEPPQPPIVIAFNTQEDDGSYKPPPAGEDGLWQPKPGNEGEYVTESTTTNITKGTTPIVEAARTTTQSSETTKSSDLEATTTSAMPVVASLTDGEVGADGSKGGKGGKDGQGGKAGSAGKSGDAGDAPKPPSSEIPKVVVNDLVHNIV